MVKYLFTLLIFGLSISLAAQLPTTDAYMLKLFNSGDNISVRNISYISNMNPDGYNNQPSFGLPNELFLTTDMYDSSYTEIVKLDLITQTYTRITQTDSLSEYSPTPKALDGFMSCIRVEKDGTTQTLRLYPNDHSDNGYRLLRELDNIGYHLWLSDVEVALFLVTTPHSLVIADIENNTFKEIATDIGRCLRQDHEGNIIYVHKVRPDLWYIKKYDPEEDQSTTIVQTLPESEDFELMPSGSLLMGNGSSLYIFDSENDDNWAEIADLYDYGIENIKRLATSRNKLIVINKR